MKSPTVKCQFKVIIHEANKPLLTLKELSHLHQHIHIWAEIKRKPKLVLVTLKAKIFKCLHVGERDKGDYVYQQGMHSKKGD